MSAQKRIVMECMHGNIALRLKDYKDVLNVHQDILTDIEVHIYNK